jgi:hypothetical protein
MPSVCRDSPDVRVLLGSAIIGGGLRYEQPVKSISFGVTALPGFTFSGFPFASTLMVCDGGVQSVAPPLIGMNAFAPTEYRTLPEAGAAQVIFPEEKIPTLGLLPGSISVYRARFVSMGAVAGQFAFESTDIFATE